VSEFARRIQLVLRAPVRLKGPQSTGDVVADTFDRLHFELEVVERRIHTGAQGDARASLERARQQLAEVERLIPSDG
jgi:hypothetical protein